MSRNADFFNFSIEKILSKDQSALDQARIRLLYYGLWIVGVAVGGLLVNVYFQHQVMLSITAVVLLGCVAILFKYLTFKPDWRFVSHALLVIATLINFSNVFIVLQKVDIICVQIMLLVILFSYYMLGQKWGYFYSLVNITLILCFALIDYNRSYFISLPPEKIDQSTVIISMFANFIVIMYVHSHFYNAFQKSITELKDKGEEQKLLNEQLAEAIEKAEKSSQVKTDFLSTMSHEIRTPLNAVIGMSNLLIMANPRPDQKENLNVLKLSANNLLAIVNDVLDFNKIEAGKVVFEKTKFELTELLKNFCDAQRLKAEEKGLNFNLKIDPSLQGRMFLGDPTRLTQILYNLVSNAVKFTKQGNIWVKAFSSEERQNKVTVTFVVKDTGIGIAKGDLQSIFEPFTQESITNTRQYGGTGLGLAIVKRLLELQGLQMNVNSKLGQGSEFSFSMDFAVAPGTSKAMAEKANDPLADDLGHLKMLIAEDNPVNVLLMKKLLSKWQIKPTFAENGERAVEMLEYGDFDIVLMDLQMPVMNGFDAAKEIRKMTDNRKAGVPIIALTAAALTDIREQVLNAGMNEYVSKPFKPEELLEKINFCMAAIH